MDSTGEFIAANLLQEESVLVLPSLTNLDAVEIGQIATELATERKLPIAIEVRIGDWIIYHVSLPGSTPENVWWISLKARTVMLKHHSTMFERVSAQERGVDCHK